MADGSPGKLQVNPATGFVAWAHALRMGGTVAVVVTVVGLAAADTNGTRNIQRRSTDRATQRAW
jgi:hypothetical protein